MRRRAVPRCRGGLREDRTGQHRHGSRPTRVRGHRSGVPEVRGVPERPPGPPMAASGGYPTAGRRGWRRGAPHRLEAAGLRDGPQDADQPGLRRRVPFGRTESRVTVENGRKRAVRGLRREREEWDVLIRDSHEGYVAWEEFERNQRLIADNANCRGFMARGAVRRGDALLAGSNGAGTRRRGRCVAGRNASRPRRRQPPDRCRPRSGNG